MDIYPYVESLKVGAAYIALLYLWPCVLFRRALRGKGLTFRFLFCALVQPVLLSTAALILGLCHLLNVWLVRVLFWGALAVSLWGPFREWRQRGGGARLPLRALLARSYGWRLFRSRVGEALARRWRKLLGPVWRRYRRQTAEYLVLTVILLFGMAFFLNGAFQDHSFGCQDQYTHYTWTDALLQGEVFPEGVYPEGMHSFLYALHVLFGVKLYSCVLFLGGIHNSSIFLLSAYCLLRELFRSRHVPLFVLAAWVTFDGIGPAMLESLTRMTWTLPEEFSLYLVFLCPLLLLRYFREENRPGKWYRDENLLLLAAGVAGAVSTHTFVLVMAFCSCCAVLLVHWRELWPARRLLPPICAALFGVEAGVLPMLAACALGTELEGSLRWGFNTLRGVVGASTRLSDPAAPDLSRPSSLWELYQSGWLNLFGPVGSTLLILLSLLTLVLGAGYLLAHRRGKLQKITLPAGMAEGYLTLTALLTIFVLLYAMPFMGLPELVTIDRTLGVTQMFAFGAAGIPADLLLLWLEGYRGKPLSRRWMALGCLFLYLAAYTTDFHQCTYWWLRRYNAAVTVADRIMDRYPAWSYKVVSMCDEAYQVGRESHEELLTFLENTQEGSYSTPVEYIFVFLEKRPIRRGQVHFLTAPRWLARENCEVYEGRANQSQCPDILHKEISQDLAQRVTPYYPDLYENYDDLTLRTVLCSKGYDWYQNFSLTHPAETNVYYEDENFICYVIHQDPAAPLELGAGRREGK